MAEFQNVVYEVDDGIARLAFNYTRRANALSPTTVREFDTCLARARVDHSVKVLIVRGLGKGFCAGHEIGDAVQQEFAKDAEMGVHWFQQNELFVAPIMRLWEFPKPVIAQVHGYVLGAGTYYALVPDITIAAENAYFQMPLVQSLGYPGAETMIEPYVFMNYKRVAEYLYTAQTLTALQALDFGLVNRVVPAEKLEETVAELASKIARAPLSTLISTKTLIRRAWDAMGIRQQFEMSNDWLALLSEAKDVLEFRERVMSSDRILPRAAAQGG